MKIPMLGSGLLYLVNRDKPKLLLAAERHKIYWMMAGVIAGMIVIIWNLFIR